MTDAGVEIRPMLPDDIPAMTSMLEPMYATRRSREFIVWQCLMNVHPVTMMGAFFEDRMVGVFGIQTRVLSNGLSCGQGSWLNISPDWQGKGLFRRLGEAAICATPNLDVLCVIANARATGPLQRSLGFRTAGAIDTLSIATPGHTSAGDTLCRPVDEETTFESTGYPSDRVMFMPTWEYRRWRFARNPAHRYWKVENGARGYAVVKLFTEPGAGTSWGDIVDIECNLNNQDRIEEILRGAIHHLRELGAGRIGLWATPGTLLRETAGSMGFAPGGHTAYLSVRVMAPGNEHLYDLSSWHLRQADATNY